MKVFLDAIEEHLVVVRESMTVLAEPMDRALVLMRRCLAAGGRVLVCGNGGSAADAQHFAAELTGRFERERRALAGIALTTDTSALTAIANDYGYDAVFARQLEGLGRHGDVLVAISTSGNSRNIIAAANSARAMGVAVVALTGAGGGALASLADVLVSVPSKRTARIQEVHGLCLHALAEGLEA